MSASTSSSTRRLPRWSIVPVERDARVRAFEWGVSLPTLALAAYLALRARDVSAGAVWLPFVVITNLLTARVWDGVVLTMGVPVLLAAGIVLGPGLTGILALIGSADQRELRREVSIGRALFNRCQVTLSAMAGASVYHLLGSEPFALPGALTAFGPALSAGLMVNAAFVIAASRLATGLPWRSIVVNLLGERPVGHLLTQLCLGSLALMLVPLVESTGAWGLVIGLAPLLLARELFAHGYRLREASRSIEAKNRALVDVSGRIAEERRDERLCIAGELHDEVIQPLYKVHLMGEVLRRDLATGRLLDLEEDLPELLEATQAAQDALRRVVRDLRDSSLGPGGLRRALEALIRSLEASCPAAIHTDLEEVGGPPLVQLLAYQIAREALQNAIKHARARVIRVSARTEEGVLRVVVEDDGVGFAPLLARSDDHFGLQLMRERAEAAGGHLYVDSAPGTGTRVMASLPTTLEG